MRRYIEDHSTCPVMYRTCVACHRVEPRSDQRRSSTCTHEPHSSAAFVSCVAAYGSVRRRGSEERLRRRGARCDVRSTNSRSMRSCQRPTCTVTTRDCRSSVNFVLRAWVVTCHIRRPVERRMCGGARSTKFTQGPTGCAQSRMHLGTVHVCLRVSNVRVITSRRAPQVGPHRRTKKKTQKSRKSRSSLYRRRFREALTSRHRLRASLLDPRPRRIHRIRQLSQSRLHLLAHERIF